MEQLYSFLRFLRENDLKFQLLSPDKDYPEYDELIERLNHIIEEGESWPEELTSPLVNGIASPLELKEKLNELFLGFELAILCINEPDREKFNKSIVSQLEESKGTISKEINAIRAPNYSIIKDLFSVKLNYCNKAIRILQNEEDQGLGNVSIDYNVLSYKWLKDLSSLELLFKKMQGSWITRDTNFEDFQLVFDQRHPSNFSPIRWHNNNATELLFFLQELMRRKYLGNCSLKRMDYKQTKACFRTNQNEEFNQNFRQLKNNMIRDLADTKIQAIRNLLDEIDESLRS